MSSSENPEVECPSCGVRNVWFADVCSSCDSSLAGASLESSNSSESIDSEDLQRSIEILCPECGIANTVSSQFCPSCGTSLNTSPENTTTALYCPNCGTENANPGRFCLSCGNPLAGIIPANTSIRENLASENVPHHTGKRCPNCSTVNFSAGQFCSSCGASLGTPDVGSPGTPENPEDSPRPSNYLPQAILATICCCIIAGIVAIVFAAQVNGKFDSGDRDGAEKAAAKAKLWVWIAFGSGIAGLVINLILSFAVPELYQYD